MEQTKLFFKEGDRITQLFGEREAYYRKFGLPGHEGTDICPPEDGVDWTVHSPISGPVIKELDDPRDGGAYGNMVTVWSKRFNLAICFCHLKRNLVLLGQEILAGDPIGVMGETGNTQGAHLHVGFIPVDFRGYRTQDAGSYRGYVDGLPIMRLLSAIPEEKR